MKIIALRLRVTSSTFYHSTDRQETVGKLCHWAPITAAHFNFLKSLTTGRKDASSSYFRDVKWCVAGAAKTPITFEVIFMYIT